MAKITDIDAQKRMTQALTNLILDSPFFGALALRLRMTEEKGIQTCATDGSRLLYNPDFVKSLTNAELQGVVCHEVLHCTNGHPWREGSRDHKKFNYAADYAINPMIIEAGMTLPSFALNEAKYAGKSAEHIYNMLPDDFDKGQGQGQGGCGIGETMPAGSSGEPGDEEGDGSGEGQATTTPASEGDWQVATIQAANAAKMMGKLPAGMERLIDSIVNPKVNWKAALQHIVQQVLARDDYSWTMPNNRYLGQGLYLPSLRSENIPPMVAVIDTSGSIGPEELAEFGAEVSALVNQCKPEKLYVLYVDSEVNGEAEEYLPGETVELSPRGGGGTDMPKAFDWIAEQGLEPSVCVILTDGYTPFGEPQGYPVVWTMSTDAVAPHGDTIHMN